MSSSFLTIGTRGSKLALAQTQLVVDTLQRANPGLDIRLKTIVTKGDVNQSPIPLDTIGKNWFTAEIEQALLSGEIDIAVHSLKDLPPEIPEHITTVTILERGDPRDILISKSCTPLKDLPHGAVVGTDSLRRKVLLLAQRPDLVIKSIRGNVDTRIKKLHDEDYDAIVLAAAGLARVGMSDVVTEFFDATTFIPAIGQGILAAQTKDDRADIIAMLHAIEHAPTVIASQAEQMFSQTIGGGCKLPIACYAHLEGDTIILDAMMGDTDGSHMRKRSARGPAKDGVALSTALAKEF